MSKPTVSAAGGAMPAEGHSPTLITVADAIDQTRAPPRQGMASQTDQVRAPASGLPRRAGGLRRPRWARR
jgi:hypothetical protein